jgi:predicted CXXCH cytochrome family protein
MFDRMLTVAAVLIAITLLSISASSDTAPQATYVGAGACRNCHSETSQFTGGTHPKTTLDCKLCHTAKNDALVKSYFKSSHAAAFTDAEDSPSSIAATFTAASPVKKSDIAFVLGSGHPKQAYLDAKLKVLPGQWDSNAKTWIKTASVDGGKQCVGCHTTGYDVKTRQWEQPNVTCESCHGPGSLHKAAGDKTKITNPASLTTDKQAMVCGQCHSKGTDTTKAYAFPINFKPGDDLSKAFIDAKPKASGMNQQYSEMLGGKHFANKVICTTCHDPHGPVQGTSHQLKKPINDLCNGCHNKDLSKHAPGAPAGITCAVCHMPSGSHRFLLP